MSHPYRLGLFSVALLMGLAVTARAEPPGDGHATYEALWATMQAQFPGFFVAQSSGNDGDQSGRAGISACARIHPFEVSEENLGGGIPRLCRDNAWGFYDWLCYFDTTYSISQGRPRVTPEEVRTAKKVTTVTIKRAGPFLTPPADVADFVFNRSGYPDHEPSEQLTVWSGSIRKFNGGVVLEDIGDPFFEIQRQHAFTYPNGVIFDQRSLEPGFHTLRLQICSSQPVRPGSPTKDSSTGPVDGWANVRVATDEECWWDRAMVIEIVAHEYAPAEGHCGSY